MCSENKSADPHVQKTGFLMTPLKCFKVSKNYGIFIIFFQVSCHTIENSECCIYLRFSNVFKDKLQQIFPR